jgi:HPt (histidine-containing phosphotransfer) domain-containing protein
MNTRPTAADLAVIDPDGSFRLRLARDLETIRGLIVAMDARRLETIVHRLAGAATTFGYDEIGGIAAGLDDAFIAARETGRGPPDVAPLIAALESALRGQP